MWACTTSKSLPCRKIASSSAASPPWDLRSGAQDAARTARRDKVGHASLSCRWRTGSPCARARRAHQPATPQPVLHRRKASAVRFLREVQSGQSAQRPPDYERASCGVLLFRAATARDAAIPFGYPVRSPYMRRDPVCRACRALTSLAAATSSNVMPATIIRASATLLFLGLSSCKPPINVAMSSPSPATRLHSPAFFSTDRERTPQATSRKP
jgi:hypothetical protein